MSIRDDDMLADYCKNVNSSEKLILSYLDYLKKHYSEYDCICIKHKFTPEPYTLISGKPETQIRFEKFIADSRSDNLNEHWDMRPILNQNKFPDYLFLAAPLTDNLAKKIAAEFELFQNIYNGFINSTESTYLKTQIYSANLISQLTHDINSLINYLQEAELTSLLDSKISYIDILIPKLLLFVRELDLTCSSLNVNDLLTGIIEINSPERIRFTPCAEEKFISCDAELINNALTAIINNAFQAASDSRDNIEVTINIIAGQSLFFNAAWAKISFIDRFGGIPDDFLPLIFKPFFTTRKNRGHSGLGLSIAEKIIIAHQGSICLTNNSFGGATVEVYLPLEKK